MSIGTGRDARLVLLAAASGGGGVLLLALAGSAIGSAFLDAWLRPQASGQLPGPEILAASAALILLGSLLVATHCFTRRVLRGQPDPSITPRPIGTGSALLLTLLWIASIALFEVLTDRGLWKGLAAVLHLLGIAVPVYGLARVAIGGLGASSRVRIWGSFTTGLILGTGIAAAAEMTLLLLVLAALAAYLRMNPQQVDALRGLVELVGQASGMEEILVWMGPLLAHPLAFLIALGAVSGTVPVIEELAKSAAPWMVYDRLSSPAQGFIVGALSGAAFALFEGLMASAQTSSNSGFVLLFRSASSLMHILASAVAGCGIAAFRKYGQPGRLLGAYALAVGLHGLWNAAVAFIVYGGIRASYGGRDTDLLSAILISAGGLVSLGLMALLPVGLVTLNRRLRPRVDATRMGQNPGSAQSGSLA